ncbi:sigma factor-like helix-turn-helix DNA-binding protein [Actinomadura fibrosa]|uniref:Sigma factor-like helix-turn-helix DNA-binding protein n=1 Tax=Actinomadura fibrosa TaxID=111802 RepID=A0ABW2XK66_9ACTN|nr:sigma factor-like helix-turn-helix DNA-binding protein [Actinomadura fibrosa]
MSRRRRGEFRDPTPRLAVHEDHLLWKALESMPQLEREVLMARYGLADGEPKTLSEIARLFGVSRGHAEHLLLTAYDDFTDWPIMMVDDGRDDEDYEDRYFDVIDVRKRTVVPPDEQLGIIRCGFCRRRFQPAPKGRPPTFCAGKCRQAAHRLRNRRARSQEQDRPPS